MSETWVPSSISSRLHPHLNFLRDVGVAVERELERENLPVTLCERPDIRYATRLVGRFIIRMERREGIEDLCYLGAKNDALSSAGPKLLPYLLAGRTLKEILDRLATITQKINGRLCSVVCNDTTATFYSSTPVSEPSSTHQRYSDWSNVMGVLIVARYVLGPQWCPDAIFLQARYPVPEAVLSEFPATRIATGCRHTSISFPAALLATKNPKHASPQDNKNKFVLPYSQHGALPEMLGAVLRPYLTGSQLSIDVAAEAAGMSVRSLQRNLETSGLSYSALIEGERHMLAREMLRDPETRITDIAYDLGYRNPTHFSRAFRRMTGQSPSQFQRALRKDA